MYSKVDIFNLSLNALSLSKQIVDAETDTSTEAKVLRQNFNIALNKTLQDLDLDSTSTTVTLEKIANNPNDLWSYVYKYPTSCAFLRRIMSCVRKDTRQTKIDKSVEVLDGIRVIYTDEDLAQASIIPNTVNLSCLNANAGMALAYQLAFLSTSLIVGKGSKEMRKQLWDYYIIYKAEAQEHDQLENTNSEDPMVESEFVLARTT